MTKFKPALSEEEWQKETEEGKQPKNQKIILKLKYRDEKCGHCGKKFRAGERCEGYMDFNIIGYAGVGVPRHGYFCHWCMEEFIYNFIGHSSLLDHDRAPSKTYTWNKNSFKKGFSSRASGMMIKGDYKKYNKGIFEKEVKRFVKWVKKNEPWNTVDYAKFSGYK